MPQSEKKDDSKGPEAEKRDWENEEGKKILSRFFLKSSDPALKGDGNTEISYNNPHFLEALLNTIPIPVFYKDRNGIFIDCNEVFAQIIGCSKEEIRGKTLPFLQVSIPEKFMQLCHKITLELGRKGGQMEQEVELVCADGKTRAFLVSRSAFKDRDGKIAGIVGVMQDITQCKASEEIVRRSEERYRIASEQTGQLVFDYDVVTGNIDWAGAIKELTGYSLEEFRMFSPEALAEHLYPENREHLLKNTMKYLTKGGRFREEFRFLRKEGNYFYAESKGVSLENERGQVYRIIGVIKDVTEQKYAREKLEKSEERYRLIAEHIGQVLYYDDFQGLAEWVGAVLEITGYSLEKFQEMTADNWMALIHPEDRERVKKAHNSCMNTGGRFLEEYRLRKKDGSYIFVEDEGFYLKNSYGVVFKALGVLKHISEQKYAQAKLEKSEERYRLIAEHVGQVLYYDGFQGLAEWAGAIFEITGYSFEEFQEMTADSWLGLIHPEDREKVKKAHNRRMDEGGKFFEEYRLRKKDGSYIFVEDEGFYLKDSNGVVFKALGVIKDVTEQKDARKKLEKSEERYRLIAEHIGQVLYYDDFQGLAEWVGAVLEITGYSLEKFQEMTADNWMALIHPEDRERVKKAHNRCMNAGGRFLEEYRLKKKDGSYIFVEDEGFYLKDSKGVVFKTLGAIKDIEDKKLAQKKLAKSEERFRVASEQIGQLVFDYDVVTGNIDWAGAIKELTGYSLEEFRMFSPETLAGHLHPENRGYLLKNMMKYLTKGGRFREEFRFLRKEGNYFYAEGSGVSLENKRGQVYRIIGVIKDVTEQKYAQEKLEKSEERYRLIAEHIGQVLYYDDFRKRVAEWAGAIPEITGYSFEEFQEMTADSWLGLIHPEDRERVEKVHDRCMDEGGRFFEEYRLKKKDGSYIFVEDEGFYLKDSNGVVFKALGVIKDIADKKLAQKKLAESEERFRVASEQTGQIVYDYELNLDSIKWAGAIEKISGYTYEEIHKFRRSKLLKERIHPQDYEKVIAYFKNAFEKGENYSQEYRFKRKTGEYIYVEDCGTFLRDEESRIYRMVGVIKNITERKEAEDVLARAEEIRKKEIHHRIKNNLQVISSLLELQADQFKEKKVREAFRESQNRVASMAIIHEELYKAEDTETIDFAVYLRKLTSGLLDSYAIRKEDIKLKLEVERVFLGVDTAIPLGIIINELVSNSLKHAFLTGEKGEIHVILSKKGVSINKYIRNVADKDKGSLVNTACLYTLIVSDNGLGFPENINFRKTDSLGLQLVNTLVEQLDATIEMETNNGTRFIINFKENCL